MDFVKISENVTDILHEGYGFHKSDGSIWTWTTDNPTPQKTE